MLLFLPFSIWFIQLLVVKLLQIVVFNNWWLFIL